MSSDQSLDRSLLLLSGALLCAAAPAARACGGLVQPAAGAVGLDAQRAFYAVHSDRSEWVVQVFVPESKNGYGLLLPVPGEPTLDPTPVDAGRPVHIGPITAVSLSAQSGAALATWLQQNGYALPGGGQRVVDGYTGPGTFLVAIKRNDSPSGGASSIGVHLTLPGTSAPSPCAWPRWGPRAAWPSPPSWPPPAAWPPPPPSRA